MAVFCDWNLFAAICVWHPQKWSFWQSVGQSVMRFCSSWTYNLPHRSEGGSWTPTLPIPLSLKSVFFLLAAGLLFLLLPLLLELSFLTSCGPWTLSLEWSACHIAEYHPAPVVDVDCSTPESGSFLLLSDWWVSGCMMFRSFDVFLPALKARYRDFLTLRLSSILLKQFFMLVHFFCFSMQAGEILDKITIGVGRFSVI